MIDKCRGMIQIVNMTIIAIVSSGCIGLSKPCGLCQGNISNCLISGRNVKPGMTKEEIIASLGAPASSGRDGGCHVVTFIANKICQSGPDWTGESWTEYHAHFDRLGKLTRVYESRHDSETVYETWGNEPDRDREPHR